MPAGPTADSAQDDKGAATFDSFAGMRNTVTPERMGPRELVRGTNVDLDDEGQLHRRRGTRKALIGRFHSLFSISRVLALVVADGKLCFLQPDYSLVPLISGVGPSPLAYVQVAQKVYFSSLTNSGIVDLTTGYVLPWGQTTDHKYQPEVDPAPAEWWYSPVANPDEPAGLGAVAGRLLAPPPLGAHIAEYNGRMYIAEGNNLWATLLYNYTFVDRNAGYRQYESKITGIFAVTDGLYVGTEQALYFVAGSFGEERRKVCEKGGVIPGTMVEAPGEILNPEGRRRPDLPQGTSKAMICMTTEGQIAGLDSGNTFNLTRTAFKVPDAVAGAAIFKDFDGMAQVVTTLDSRGTPQNQARAGDYCEATIIRKFPETASAAEPLPPQVAAAIPSNGPAASDNRIRFVDLAGNELFEGTING